MSQLLAVFLLLLVLFPLTGQQRPTSDQAGNPPTPMQNDALDLTQLPNATPGAAGGQTMPIVNYDNLKVETAADRNPQALAVEDAPPPAVSRPLAIALGGTVLVAFLSLMGLLLFHPAFTGKRKLRDDMPD
jgi:hypothetical protein